MAFLRENRIWPGVDAGYDLKHTGTYFTITNYTPSHWVDTWSKGILYSQKRGRAGRAQRDTFQPVGVGSQVQRGGRERGTTAEAAETSVSLVLQSQILAKVSETALVVAVAGPGLMAPPPSGPRQHRFVQRHWPPDQPVQQSAYLGNRQRYQGFIPLRFSPFLP